jgi:TPR repeat protein
MLRTRKITCKFVSALIGAVALANLAAAGPWEDYEAANSSNDSAAAIKILRSLALQGDAKAQAEIGVMYEVGSNGLTKDLIEASKWYRLAAAQGNTDSQYWLGTMYAEGRGVPQDYQWAHKWLNLAASRHAEGDFRDQIVKARDAVAAKMTPVQIVEAQKLARAFKETPGRNARRRLKIEAARIAAPRPVVAGGH